MSDVVNEFSVASMITVCVKWVDLRPEIDRLSGAVTTDHRRFGFSAADQAAMEVATRVAEQLGRSVRVVTVGPPEAESALREIAAVAASPGETSPVGVAAVEVVRIDGPEGCASPDVAASIADLVAGDRNPLVICGDYSADRGSGSVPGFVAHQLGVAQSLGVVEITDVAPDGLRVVRRLDGGRREHLALRGAAVISVEGSVARLRRAPLSSVLTMRSHPVRVATLRRGTVPALAADHNAAIRPRARVLPAPTGSSALQRVVELTGAMVDRTPPRRVEADPAEAAASILEQLAAWGYLADS